VNNLETTETVPSVSALAITTKIKWSCMTKPYVAWTSLLTLPAIYTSVRPIKNSKNMINVIGQLTDQLWEI
jgi:hypothetical protein